MSESTGRGFREELPNDGWAKPPKYRINLAIGELLVIITTVGLVAFTLGTGYGS